MYLAELKLWNFRKYGSEEFDLAKSNLAVPFNRGLNVLIGENDSGKTAILDAIKLVLKTHAYEWIKVEPEDFYTSSDKLRIELKFDGLQPNEAKSFVEWLGWEGEEETAKPILRLLYQIERRNDRIIPADVKAGMDETGYSLDAEAREYLKTTYLKALRDADNDLIAKKNSRLSQIFQGHELFKKNEGRLHEFEELFISVNSKIEEWFKDDEDLGEGKTKKKLIKDIIDNFLHAFIDNSTSSNITLTDPEIKNILEKIALGIKDGFNMGLGTMNRLYMAVELLHLKKDWDGLKLCLIEELEAHLHPQAQMKVIEALQKEPDVQFILTTHSPNLASKVKLKKLLLCDGNEVFSLDEQNTQLEKDDYKYLERFLDVTKSNLFFAKGVIIVEGWSEEILIPAIAKKIGCDLTKHEVSIVNVGSTAYLHFAKIFLRNDEKTMKIPVSVIPDLDVIPNEKGQFDNNLEKNVNKR
jgi:putative ATP-dependent endonuclease of OLD family